MLGTYVWRGAETRYLTAFAYDEFDITTGQVGFDQAKVLISEFGFLQVIGGPARALWYPGCSVKLANNFGFTFYHANTTTLNRLEMFSFLATLDAAGTAGKLCLHYYAPPIV